MKKLLIAICAITVVAIAGIGNFGAAREPNKNAMSNNMYLFNQIFKEVQAGYVDSLDADALTRRAIDAMLSGIDPYTEYYPPEEVEDLTTISSGTYGGIGSIISTRDGRVYISHPTWGTPSRKAGLRHGDVILEINGEAVDSGMPVDKVSRRLRGQAGSTVTVKVRRPWVETDSILTFDLVRRNIEVNPLPYFGVDSAGVGYIRLTTFNNKSAGAVRDAVNAMKREGRLRGLILDLRSNGGGLLESAVQIVGLFVPKGTEVVRMRGSEDSGEKIYKTTRKPLDTEVPLVVMIDESTASSSEIVAGALQDLDRAVIVGSRSYGKGLVQSSRPLFNNGMVKITTARYFIPSGRLIQAIDYRHRDSHGNPARIPDSLTKVWYTAAGRPVRDGGGITPDVAVADTAMNRLLYNVISDMWAYDFANRFRARHDSISVDWTVDDSVFADFKAFIDPARFKYDRMSEMGIDYLRDAARLEGYLNDSVEAQIDRLAAMMRHDLQRDLDFNRDELIEIIDGEISERYFDDGLLVKRSLRYDLEADTARAVVLDPVRYRALLTPKSK